MSEPVGPSAEQEKQFHTYTTHAIPWFVRLIWVAFWIACIWYIIRLAIPSARNYF